MGLALWLSIWVIILFAASLFAILDAYAAFDRDPTTHTFSEYIKKYKHRSLTGRGACIVGLSGGWFVMSYLTGHLWFEWY